MGLCVHDTVKHQFFQVGIFALMPAVVVETFSLNSRRRLPPQRVLVFGFLRHELIFFPLAEPEQ